LSSIALACFAFGAQADACSSYSPTDIANAISNSSTANSSLKSTACTWGGAGKSESGGNTCASNGNNFGALQLSTANVQAAGYTPAQYTALPLQQQVDVWATQVGNANASGSNVASISNAAATGQSFGGTPATSGMAAACVQFGPTICSNDLAALQAGQPCGGASPILAGHASDWRTTATEDGNGQSICSWGANIQQNINNCAANCNPSYNSVTGGVSMPGPAPTTTPSINSAPGLITVSAS
jgi:hypothetical protein